MQADSRRKGRWYFGGLSSAGAACCTHPLDLLMVHLPTGSGKTEGSLLGHVAKVSTIFNYNVPNYAVRVLCSYHCRYTPQYNLVI